MILTIDIGNSRIKWVQFEGAKTIDHSSFSYDADVFEGCLNQAGLPLDVDKIVISNVAGVTVEKALTAYLNKAGCNSYRFVTTQAEQCGVVNSYREYAALGVDRWLAMIAGFYHPEKKHGQAVCVIDCGTAMTLDIVNSKGVHLGGVIAPGFNLMLSMLNKRTSNIQVDAELGSDEDEWLSSTTSGAVKHGCARLLVAGINSMLRQSLDEHGDVFFIITGGDGGWVSDALEINVVLEPLLVNLGLLRVSCEG